MNGKYMKLFMKANDFKKFMALQNNPANPMWETWTTGKFLNNWSKDMDGAIDSIIRRKFNFAQNMQLNTELLYDKKSSENKQGNQRYSKTSYARSRQKLEGFTTKKPMSSKKKIEFRINRRAILQKYPKPRCHNEISKMLKDLIKGVKTPRNPDLNTIQFGGDLPKQSRNLISKWMSTPDLASKPSTPFFILNRPKKNPYFEMLKNKRKRI